ncbi:MAG: glycosyltransferase [Paracoccaceae bacterium]
MPPAMPTVHTTTSPDKSNRPRIAVGCITRGRPAMFAKALSSLTKLDLPVEFEVVFCFVENAETLSVQEEIETFRTKVPSAEIHLTNEPRLGIPFARNRVLDLALNTGCEFLAFLDDDEIVDPLWLKNLYATIKARDLDLVGGPVRTLAPVAALSFGRRKILNGLIARAKRIERVAALRTANKLDHTVSIVTNNWLVRLGFLRKTGIRFDDGLGLSGGSDIAIFREIRAAGGKTGWAPTALVYEEIPEGRLSLSYQYARGRDQQLATYNIKRGQAGQNRMAASIVFILAKSLLGGLRVLFSPLFGGTTLVLGLRSFGAAVGRMKGLMGRESEHYHRVAGH